MHKNVPGVLSAINHVFSDNHINIAAQHLQTNEGIGYVVIDIDPDDRNDTRALQRELDAIQGTIRTRVLY